MSKRPTDHLLPPTKKRGADRQITQDDPDSDGGEHEPTGEFAKASAETLKKRKIVRARRPGSAMVAEPTPSAAPAVLAATNNPFTGIALKPSAASSNPFFSVNLTKPAQAPAAAGAMAGTQQEQAQQVPASVPPAAAAGTDVKEPAAAAQTQPPAATAAPAAAGVGSAEPQVEAQQPAAAQPQAAAAADGSAPAADAATVPPTTSGQEAPAAAAAPKLATFGAGSSMFSGGGFGALGQSGTTFGFASGAGTKDTAKSDSQDGKAAPAFSFGAAGTSFPSVASVLGTSDGTDGEAPAADPKRAVQLPPAGPLTTGEEEEESVFKTEGTLFEFFKDGQGWRERGRGELRLNKSTTGGRARVVMRQKGSQRVILNANLWQGMIIKMMDGDKGVTFSAHNTADASQQPGTDAASTADKEAPLVPMSAVAFRKKEPQKLLELKELLERHSAEASAVAQV